MPNDFDKTKDKLLEKISVKGEREGFKFELMSYDGYEPKLKIERYYKDSDGSWQRDPKTKFPRFSMRLIRALIENSGKLDNAFAEWEKSKPKKNESNPRDDSF